MATQFPVVLNAGSGLTLDPNTPLIEALRQTMQDGASLRDAVITLAQNASLEVKQAIDRLTRAGVLVVEPGGKHLQLTTLASNSQPITLELKAERAATLNRADGALGISLVAGISVEAALALVLDVLDAMPDGSPHLSVPASDVLHRCRLGGNVGVTASVKPMPAELSADGRWQAAVAWYFQRHREDTVLGSLADAAFELSDGVLPWNLADVHRVLSDSDGPNLHRDGLRAIDIESERSIVVAGALKVSRGIAVTKQDGEDVDIKISAGVEAKLGFSLARSGRFRIRLSMDAGKLVLELNESSKRSSGHDASVGVSLGVEGMDGVVKPWLDQLAELDQSVRDFLDRWSKPGDKLVEALRSKLTSTLTDEIKPLAELVLGQVGSEQTAETLVDGLLARWQTLLDERAAMFDGLPDVVVDRLMELSLPDTLDRTHPYVIKARGWLAEAIDEQVNKAKTEVQALANQIKGKGTAELKKILAPLEQIGENVETLASTLNNNASALLVPLQKLLTRYEKLRKALNEGVRKAALLKLSAAWSESREKTSGQTRALRLSFTQPANSNAAALFRDLVLGRGPIDIEHIQAMGSDGVNVESGHLLQFSQVSRTASFTLDLFGLKFSDARILNAKARIETDTAGRILAFDGQSTQERISIGPSGEQRARFSADFDFLDASEGSVPGTLGLGFSLTDDKLKPKELRQYLSSFVDAGLLHKDTQQRIAATLGDENVRNVDIAIALLGLPAVMPRTTSTPDAEYLTYLENIKRIALDRVLTFAARTSRGYGKQLDQLDRTQLLAWAKAAFNTSGAGCAARESNIVNESSKKFARLEREFRFLNRVIGTIPSSIERIRELQSLGGTVRIAALDEDEARAAERRLNNALVALQQSMKPMVDVNTALVRMFNQRLPDYTVGLLATLKELDTSGSLRAQVSIRRFSLDNEGKRRYEEPTFFD